MRREKEPTSHQPAAVARLFACSVDSMLLSRHSKAVALGFFPFPASWCMPLSLAGEFALMRME